jgi:hypothetical protein
MQCPKCQGEMKKQIWAVSKPIDITFDTAVRGVQYFEPPKEIKPDKEMVLYYCEKCGPIKADERKEST